MSAADLQTALSAIANLLPEWHEAIEENDLALAQHEATNKTYAERIRKLGPGRAGARLALRARMASDMLPLAERRLAAAQTYSSTTLDLAPHVRTAIRIVKAHPEEIRVLDDLTSAVDEAVANIKKPPPPHGEPVAVFARRNAHLSRAMARLADTHERAQELTRETNEAVLSWRRDLDELVTPIESEEDG